MSFVRHLKKFGPGLLVTAAFIGPGTVTSASLAGSRFGFALLWAVVFSTIATIILQEMAARLGIVTRLGLGEAIRFTFRAPLAKGAACCLVAGAIGFGNAAYQTGNITGAALGMSLITGASQQVWSVLLGIAAFALLFSGHYKLIERVLIALVILMSIMFIVTAVVVRPDLGDLVRGALVPTVPQGSVVTIVALIGTTVVPYNLFLHASAVREKWPTSMPISQSLSEARLDTSLAVILGGLITAAILATAAATYFGQWVITNPADMARQLEPLLGHGAKICFAGGLLAAGLTSAITAPLAASYAICGVFGWKQDLGSARFRAIWMVVLTSGVVLASIGNKKSPQSTILIAQALNGVLLPLIAIFLLMAVNRRKLMGPYRNGWIGNVLGGIVVLVATGLGLHALLGFFADVFSMGG